MRSCNCTHLDLIPSYQRGHVPQSVNLPEDQAFTVEGDLLNMPTSQVVHQMKGRSVFVVLSNTSDSATMVRGGAVWPMVRGGAVSVPMVRGGTVSVPMVKGGTVSVANGEGWAVGVANGEGWAVGVANGRGGL